MASSRVHYGLLALFISNKTIQVLPRICDICHYIHVLLTFHTYIHITYGYTSLGRVSKLKLFRILMA